MTRRVALGAPSDEGRVVAEVVASLRRSEVVVLPAEGLYGYHVLADRRAARNALLQVKPRDPERGWIVLVEGLETVWDAPPGAPWRAAVSPAAERLARHHWPGALTLVLPLEPDARGGPNDLAAKDGTVALRAPGNPFLLAVLAASGSPLVTTSANRPGGPAPRTLDACALDGVALAVDAGPLTGNPSTIVRVDGSDVRILRSGAVHLEGQAP